MAAVHGPGTIGGGTTCGAETYGVTHIVAVITCAILATLIVANYTTFSEVQPN